MSRCIASRLIHLFLSSTAVPQVGLVDLDICGPSIPKLMSVGGDVVVNGPYGWVPLRWENTIIMAEKKFMVLWKMIEKT